MNYELAKKLKDAGFPILPSNMGTEKPKCGGGYEIDGRWYYEVTLSDLIEACGELELGLYKYKRNSDNLWTWGADNDSMDRKDGENTINTTGSTPEIAVANLWLALNKKDVQSHYSNKENSEAQETN